MRYTSHITDDKNQVGWRKSENFEWPVSSGISVVIMVNEMSEIKKKVN